jgi:hypothetical protein
MEVTFGKASSRRYTVAVDRATGPRLATRVGPGNHPYIPHDVAHFVVEVEDGITGGIFGQLAAGYCGFFWPVDPDERRRAARRAYADSPWHRAQMARSEHLAAICVPLWEVRSGHREESPAWFSRFPPELLESPVMSRIQARLDEIAARWHALRVRQAMTLPWPYADARRLAHRHAPARYRAPVRRQLLPAAGRRGRG